MSTPRAWLGLSPVFVGKRVARICMDCPDKAAAEQLAIVLACDGMSHGLCEACAAVRMNELLSTPTFNRSELSEAKTVKV